jgi:hypothetical protein
MYCQECVEQDLEHHPGSTWDGQDASHLFGVIPNRHREHLSANRILEEYTRRSLSYPADALNACLGIMKVANIHHWANMPVEADSACQAFTLNLHWSPTTLSHRRADFLTWSWTSVVGQKRFPEIKSLDDSLCSISIPTGNDQWQSVAEWMTLNRDIESYHQSPLLQVTAPIVEANHFPPQLNCGMASWENNVVGRHVVIQTPH